MPDLFPDNSLLQRYVVAGGFMMAVLIPLAVLALAFVLQGFVNLRGSRICPRRFQDDLGAVIRETPDCGAITRFLRGEEHALARVLDRVLVRLEMKADADPTEVLREEVEDECATLQQRNSQLGAVYNIAPLLGLLGTVFGMLRTFGEFTTAADPSVRELSIGINLALLTTAWGLSIAIPAYLFLTVFVRRIGRYEHLVLPRAGMAALQAILSTGEIAHPSSAAAARTSEAPPAGDS